MCQEFRDFRGSMGAVHSTVAVLNELKPCRETLETRPVKEALPVLRPTDSARSGGVSLVCELAVEFPSTLLSSFVGSFTPWKEGFESSTLSQISVPG